MAEDKNKNTLLASEMVIKNGGLAPRTLQEVKLVADTFIASGLVPEHFDSAAKVIVAVQVGAELGLKIWQSLQNLYVVHGKIGISSSMIGGLIHRHGKPEVMKQFYEGEKYKDDYKAIVISKRKGGSEGRTEFSVEDAKRAGLWDVGTSWKKYPDDMLMWRALSRHGRHFYGDIMGGLYTEEELSAIKPDPAYETTTPKRDDRIKIEAKVVEEVNVPNKLAACIFAFQTNKRIKDGDIVGMFACFSSEILGGVMEDYINTADDVDFIDPDKYTVDMVIKLQEKVDGISGTKSQPEEESPPENKYQCMNENCEVVCFVAPTENGLCPGCLTKDFEEINKGKVEVDSESGSGDN